MTCVKIQVFHENGGAAKTERKLIRTIWIDTESEKGLTGKRAGQILANNLPEFDNNSTRNGLIKGEKCWWKRRTIRPTQKCSYHYIWEYAVITEETE